MDNSQPNRRSFITKVALAASIIGTRHRAIASPSIGSVFYVAGTRFQKLRRPMRIGDEVAIAEGEFQGDCCYTIYTSEGEMVGYVPRSLIAAVRNSRATRGRVLLADLYAVPWRRYKVGLLPLLSQINQRVEQQRFTPERGIDGRQSRSRNRFFEC